MNRMPRSMVAPLVMLLAVVLPCARAGAVDPKIEAKQQFQEAEAHYDAGRWAEAAAGYQRAYALAPYPSLLFNIAQAYRNQGDAAKAVEYYRKYLVADPKGKRVAEAQQHLAALETKIPKPASVEPPPPLPPPTKPSPEPIVAKPAEPPSPPPPAKKRAVWPWLVAGGAVVAGGLALGLGLAFGQPKDGPLNPDYDTVKVGF